jgi:hypothetical protein
MSVCLIMQLDNGGIPVMRAVRLINKDCLPEGSTSLTIPGCYFYSIFDYKKEIKIMHLPCKTTYTVKLAGTVNDYNTLRHVDPCGYMVRFHTKCSQYLMALDDFVYILRLDKTKVFPVTRINSFTFKVLVPHAPTWINLMTPPVGISNARIYRDLYYLGFLKMHQDVLKKNVGIVRLIARFIGASPAQCKALTESI